MASSTLSEMTCEKLKHHAGKGAGQVALHIVGE